MTSKRLAGEIEAALKRAGATVARVATDTEYLFVEYAGKLFMLGVRTPKAKMTRAQLAWWSQPFGTGGRAVVRSADEALDAIGAPPF